MTIAQTQPATSDAERLVLQHVVVLHRHGDRSPVFESSGANLRVGPVEKQFWTEQLAAADQLAELSKMGVVVGPTPDQQPAAAPRHGGVFPGGNVTKRGLARMQRVGEKLRERYGDFIDPSWSNDQVFVESTNFFRTIQSCQSLLAGLFPPSAAPDRAPFFIRTNEFDSLSPSHPMDVYDNLEARLEKDLTAKYGPGGYDALRERAYASLGADRSKPVPWSAARDIIDCNRAHEVPIPTAIPDAVVAEICEVDCWMWHQLYGNLEFCRQFFRKGVREVFGILEQAAKQTNAHKLAVLSAHDSSIVSLLKMLHVDLPTDSVPTYGSTLCIETYIDPVTNAAFVKLDLNDKPLTIGSSALRASKDCDAATSSTGMTPFREVEVLVTAFFAEA